MTRRRRKWIIATTLLTLAAALWWCFGRGGGRFEVKLVFLGYTNAMLTNFTTLSGPLFTNTIQVQQAMVMITNRGETPVKVSFMRNPTAEGGTGAAVNLAHEIWMPSPAGKDTLAPG